MSHYNAAIFGIGTTAVSMLLGAPVLVALVGGAVSTAFLYTSKVPLPSEIEGVLPPSVMMEKEMEKLPNSINLLSQICANLNVESSQLEANLRRLVGDINGNVSIYTKVRSLFSRDLDLLIEAGNHLNRRRSLGKPDLENEKRLQDQVNRLSLAADTRLDELLKSGDIRAHADLTIVERG